MEVRFTLKDEMGASHKYEVTLHPARKGSLLRARLGALVAEPLAMMVYEVVRVGNVQQAIAVMLASLASDDQLTNPGKRAEIDAKRAEIMALVDPAKLAVAVKNALLSLPEDLVFALFEHVTRDGIRIGTSGFEDEFDAAYAANYTELEAALWEVVKANRFLSLPAIFSVNSPA